MEARDAGTAAPGVAVSATVTGEVRFRTRRPPSSLAWPAVIMVEPDASGVAGVAGAAAGAAAAASARARPRRAVGEEVDAAAAAPPVRARRARAA